MTELKLIFLLINYEFCVALVFFSPLIMSCELSVGGE